VRTGSAGQPPAAGRRALDHRNLRMHRRSRELYVTDPFPFRFSDPALLLGLKTRNDVGCVPDRFEGIRGN
jgi:hypothetical protein